MVQRTPPTRRSAADGSPNYWARRVGALVVVLVVVYALVRAVGAVIGGDDGIATADRGDSSITDESDGDASLAAAGDERSDDDAESDQTDLDCSDDANATLCAELGLDDEVTVSEAGELDGDGDGDVETTAEVEADDEPVYTGPPTSSNPAEVYIVGDSDAGTFGPYLETLLDGTLVTTTDLNYKVSSGLARPDFFNWPAELAEKLPEVDPDIVVVTFGGNDSQGLTVPELSASGRPDFIIGDPVQNEAEWSDEYQRRVGEVMDLLLENDRHVIWVGIPNDDSADVTAKLAIQDRAAKAAAAERPEVVFVDTWTRFSGRDGNWAEFVIDPRDNSGKDVRAEDGFHLNQNGAEILAIDIAIEVQNELRAMGANL